MKKQLLCLFLLSLLISSAVAQVTRLSNNTSYEWGFPLNNSKIILRSTLTNTLWAYDIPGNSFAELSSTAIVQSDYSFGFFNGELYFAGRTALEGIELWKTDGTPGGTSMVKDINLGGGDSNPAYGFITYNNELYFTAIDASGRELWKTNGTLAGTVQVKDINSGPSNAFSTTTSNAFAVINGVLVFTATAANGDELWKTDGTDPGTFEIKNIEPAPGTGSHISSFTELNNQLLFTAFDVTNGDQLWKTDGTISGTLLVKDINPNPPAFPPPFLYLLPDITPRFFNFQNTLYFSGNDGVNGYELWKTDGTTGGTTLVKDINPGVDDGSPQLFLAVKNSSKFFFSAMTAAEGTELWESDGTTLNTKLLTDITGDVNGSDPIILPNFFGSGLFQGDKFFFIATTPSAEGSEFYVSDGTASGTKLLNDINPGIPSGYNGTDLAWFYAGDKFYFVADNGIDGAELWQSDGTQGAGTNLLANINTNAGEGSAVNTMINVGNTLYFFGTDGDDPVNTDYFKLDASLMLLPLRWISFEARPSNNDVLLIWETAAEEQTDHFIVQRSADGVNYKDIGVVNAHGTGSNNYSFTDAGAMTQAVKKWYYRIKDVDKDNKSALSRVATVALNKSIASVIIAPNPVVNELKLVIQAATNDDAVIRVINMKGQVVLEKSTGINRGRNTVTADASGLSNGVYMLQITTGESSTSERFMIQH